MPFEAAKHIVQVLKGHGYLSYFAGGWVRDMIMKCASDDVDIATNAPPEVILTLFPKTIQVGLAFGVVIVKEKGHQFEVSTFRQDFGYEDGRKPTRIALATPHEDALRRDFTINGMFYDPLEDTIHDYVGGIEDIERGIIRTIGNPEERFEEDRLRMIRAIRFAARFRFHIDAKTEEAILDNAPRLFPSVAMERIWQEFNKMAAYPGFEQALVDLHRLGLLPEIFPSLRSLHLNDLKKKVRSVGYYPPRTPAVAFLTELFEKDELPSIGERLHLSKKEIELALFLKTPFPSEKVTWAHFYAHPHAELALVLKSNPDEHRERKTELATAIERIRQQKPLVHSSHLLARGISPGKQMGELLKKAEKIAIENQLEDPQEVLKRLFDDRN